MILTKEKLKSVDIDFITNQKLLDGRINEILFIVPTNRKARNLKKELIGFSKNSSAYQIRVETLTTISSKLLSESNPFHQISEALSLVLIKQAVKQCKLRYLSQYVDEIPPGTLDKIRNVITEYKRQGIRHSDLRKEAENLEPPEKDKALDIADIYELYKQRCVKLKALDIGDVYDELMQIDEKIFLSNVNRLYRNIEYIFIDGFHEFSQPEIQIINRLSSYCKLFISFDFFAGNPFLFSHLEKCFDSFSALGFNEIADARNDKEKSFRDYVKKNLFGYLKIQQRDYSERIYKICGYNKESEVEQIAKQIKLILQNEHEEPHKICVAFNLVQEYSTVVKDIFDKIGIPLNLTDRTPLENADPVIAIISFLEIVESDYYYKNIFRAINSGFISLPSIDADNLFRTAAGLKIVSGKENWFTKINDAINGEKNYGDDTDRKLEVKSLIRAQKDLLEIAELLKAFEKPLTVDEFLQEINNFILASNIPYNLLRFSNNHEVYVRAVVEFLETIKELFELQKEEIGIDKKLQLHFFLDQIRTACGWARFNVKERSNFGVLVTSIEEIRGLKFDYLFIAGMCEGLFPTKYSPEIFSSGKFKKQAFAHQSEERFAFYKAITSWKKKLFLCYHLSENGKETVPSNFFASIEKLFNIGIIPQNNYDDWIFSEEQLLIEYPHCDKLFDWLNEKQRRAIEKSIIVQNIRNDKNTCDSAYIGNLNCKDDLSITAEDYQQIEDRLTEKIKKEYSISQLELYAKCPFKFFLEKLIGIKTIEKPSEDVEAIEMGKLLHSILYEFYIELRRQKLVLQQCNDTVFNQAKKIIFEIASKQLNNAGFKSLLNFYEVEKILGLSGNEQESILYRFIEYERASSNVFIPQHFEVSFGKVNNDEADNELSSNEAIVIDGIKLRGKIDRIEINNEDSTFNVVDYKLSGTKPSFSDIKQGLSLQLPLYLYAAQELLTKKMNRNFYPNEMFIYSLKYSKEDFGKIKISLGKNKETGFNSVHELIQNSLYYVKKYISNISNGEFRLSSLKDREEKVCRFCNYRLTCRVDNYTD